MARFVTVNGALRYSQWRILLQSVAFWDEMPIWPLQSVVHRERSSRSLSILRVDVRRENAPVVNLQLAVFFEVLKRIPCSEG